MWQKHLNCKLLRFFLPVLHELVEVFLHILKDKIQMIVFSDNLLQFHHIGVVQLLQCLVGQSVKRVNILNNKCMFHRDYLRCSEKSAHIITIHTFTSLRFIHSSHE